MSEANKAVNTLIIALVDCGRRDEAFLVAENCAYVTGFARQKLDRQGSPVAQPSCQMSILQHEL